MQIPFVVVVVGSTSRRLVDFFNTEPLFTLVSPPPDESGSFDESLDVENGFLSSPNNLPDGPARRPPCQTVQSLSPWRTVYEPCGKRARDDSFQL
jgi:hypothetical protein